MHKFTRPALPYAYDSLTPWIDAQTMEIHHSKHHQAYIDKLNQALEDRSDLEYPSDLATFCKKVGHYHSDAIRNNLGGHYNHTFFWTILSPQGGGTPSDRLKEAIEKDFNTIGAFKAQFKAKALGQFGSGWAWLAVNKKGGLFVTSTPNQDNPLMDIQPPSQQGTPILGIDVWEHAYYLSYQNKRPNYVEAFWQVVNWQSVEEHYHKAIKR